MEDMASQDLEKTKRQEVQRRPARLGRAIRRRYTPKLCAELAVYIRDRLAQGASRNSVCHELRMGWWTLDKIMGKQPTATTQPVLRRVRVVKGYAPAATVIPIVVRGPGGVIVEGMDIACLAALFRALS